ncbi:hypothetical protein OV208_37900 [Corallococcus sp. bb12-1]|uniref:hypothetical protein n=1 Tax=Corallococcus sp. bb12-1 TaxID=2996784 RepID=UPI00226F9DF2|nr:hypothetical protein [Corallococcus sp. bb12-1]MCY1047138.1 hypothetical protein [Corallococcus sp. bb12-1]
MEEFPLRAGIIYPVYWRLNRGGTVPERTDDSSAAPVNAKVIPDALHRAFDPVGRVSEVWSEATP